MFGMMHLWVLIRQIKGSWFVLTYFGSFGVRYGTMMQIEKSNLTEIRYKAGSEKSFLWLPPLLSPIPKQHSLIIFVILNQVEIGTQSLWDRQKNPKQTSFWKSVFQLRGLQQRQKDLIKFKCCRNGMFYHVSNSTLVKSSCTKDAVKTYWPSLEIEKFIETPLKVKWYSARTWDFTRGTLSDFYVMVIYPYPSILQQDCLQFISM